MSTLSIMEECDTALLVIDVQTKLIDGIKNKNELIRNLSKLIKVSKILDVETIISEQNPDKLGNTIECINIDETNNMFNKMTFSCLKNAECLKEILSLNKRNIVISGIESHICVLQTCLDLISNRFNTYLVVDAIGSRNDLDHKIAVKRMQSAGAILTTTESAIFEWCKSAERKEFKPISKIIKESIK